MSYCTDLQAQTLSQCTGQWRTWESLKNPGVQMSGCVIPGKTKPACEGGGMSRDSRKTHVNLRLHMVSRTEVFAENGNYERGV